ncbi:MAG: GNAT family N-acetyltransferase [Rhodospirillales bacterium]|jgi:DNA-binding MarR family transcriptional regulator/GNAT superfamily N-acetyltransferase
MMVASHAQTDAVRRFSRLFTARLGVLRKSLYGSRFSLAEARVLYELATRPSSTAGAIAADLGIDPGYMSRICSGLARAKLLRRAKVAGDGRQRRLELTKSGAAAFAKIDAASRAEVAALLEPLEAPARRTLVEALAQAEQVLDPQATARPRTFVLRAPLPGDLGWIVHRHGAIYAAEYGWDAHFEADVAAIAANFAAKQDPACERCWIAESAGAIVGAVVVVREDRATARMRLFYLEAEARGLSLARHMVETLLAFARQAGYRRIVLSTYANLTAARKLYEKFGFVRTAQSPKNHYGKKLVAEDWALDLA